MNKFLSQGGPSGCPPHVSAVSWLFFSHPLRHWGVHFCNPGHVDQDFKGSQATKKKGILLLSTLVSIYKV
jgi:hypothetical protein